DEHEGPVDHGVDRCRGNTVTLLPLVHQRRRLEVMDLRLRSLPRRAARGNPLELGDDDRLTAIGEQRASGDERRRGAGDDDPHQAAAAYCGSRTASSMIMAAAFSPIIVVGALVLPPTSVGMIDASHTRRPVTPRTRRRASTTAIGSTPILQVPTGG